MQLLKLRYLQLKRDLSYWVLIFAAMAFLITKNISEFSQNYCLIPGACAILFLYTYHAGRKDLNFISKYFLRPIRELCITYTLLLLPVSSAMVLSGDWFVALGLHALSILVIFIPVKVRVFRLHFISRYVPASQFEWIAGLRGNFAVLLFLLLPAIFFSPVKLFATVALFLMNSIFLGFYGNFEPLVMLNPENLSSGDFLKKKTAFFHKVLFFTNLPLLLINAFFQPDVAWFNACFLIGFLLLASSAVYIKYAGYKPNGELHFHIDSLLLFASALIPFLLPLALLLTFSHKKKALQNLLHYIDDTRKNPSV